MKNKSPHAVVFSDLDGTLLNDKYEFTDVADKIKQLLSLNVALVLCSSKTAAEIEHYRNKLKITDPFISENGGAIFIPKNYFVNVNFTRETDQYAIIELGVPYGVLRQHLQKIRVQTGAQIVGFGDLTVNEIAAQCGLSPEMAELAKQREYDEPFQILDGNVAEITRLLQQEGLTVTKGDRYYHLTGSNNKGTATAALNTLYHRKFGAVCTFGVGNGPNDVPMLNVVDNDVFVHEGDDLGSVWAQILTQIVQATDKP